jgi:hypothetical protein
MNSRAWHREAMLLRSGAGQESGRAAANGSCSQLLLRIMRTSQTRFPRLPLRLRSGLRLTAADAHRLHFVPPSVRRLYNGPEL